MAFDMYRRLRAEVQDLKREGRNQESRNERAEVAGAVEAFTLALAPTATGLGDNSSYTSLAWISNALKPGETPGNGTGVLCIFDASTSQWLRLPDYVAATT